MVWQRPEGMDEYLKPTKLCDCDNVMLKEKAEEIIRGARLQKRRHWRFFTL